MMGNSYGGNPERISHPFGTYGRKFGGFRAKKLGYQLYSVFLSNGGNKALVHIFQ